MTPEERAEIDEMHQNMKTMFTIMQSLQKNLDGKAVDLEAKTKDLEAKAAQLNTLTYQASAFSVILIALQTAFNASNPQHRALFTATLVQARRDFHGRLLFTTVPDATVEKFDEALKRLVDPDLHSFLQ